MSLVLPLPQLRSFVVHSTPHILIAEDDAELRTLLEWAFRAEGFEVSTCSNGVELLNAVRSLFSCRVPVRYNLIISDIRMPGITGMEVLEGLSKSPCFPPMILITAFGDPETHRTATNLGAAYCVDKPFAIDDLIKKARTLTSESSGPAA